MSVHRVKSWPEFYRAIIAGARKHELRPNDRNYTVGDILVLEEYDPIDGRYTGATFPVKVTSITSEERPCAVSAAGLMPGFCILSIQPYQDSTIEALLGQKQAWAR